MSGSTEDDYMIRLDDTQRELERQKGLVESLQQKLAEAEKDRKYWQKHCIHSDETMLRQASVIDGLKEELCHSVSELEFTTYANSANEKLNKLQKQLSEAKQKLTNIINEDNAITAETSKQLAQLHKDYELVEQERDKLQFLVQEQRAELDHVLKELTEWCHCIKERGGDWDNWDSYYKYFQFKGGLERIKKVLSITPDNLPRFVPESEIEAFIQAIKLILPMAKGWAATHSVGSNQKYCDDVEGLLSAYTKAEKEGV